MMKLEEINGFVERITIQTNRTIDNMIFGEIQKIATENGFDTKITLNEKAVVSALSKQIPTKPIGRHTSYKCPICDRRVRSGKGSSSFGVDHFCQRCGQALDWSDTE